MANGEARMREAARRHAARVRRDASPMYQAQQAARAGLLDQLRGGDPTPYEELLRVQTAPVTNWNGWRAQRTVLLNARDDMVVEVRAGSLRHLVACTEDLLATRHEKAELEQQLADARENHATASSAMLALLEAFQEGIPTSQAVAAIQRLATLLEPQDTTVVVDDIRPIEEINHAH